MRFNFSHGTHEERVEQTKWIRKASKELGKPVAIIQDLQGPKIRLGDFEDTIEVKRGETLRFGYDTDWHESGVIPTQFDLSDKVKRGERLFLFDGKVRCTVKSVKGGIVYAEAMNDGVLLKRKGMNLPDTDFHGDVITQKDKIDLAFGSQQDFDYVAMSFVQTAADVDKMRRLIANLGSPRKLIVKVETQLAVENIEAIVQASDAVMIARGDLAVETLPESVPIVQQKIIGFGLKYSKPTIVATQMLASMTEVPEPTRAEVSDIATAVLVGADCVMLSEETATGHYPVGAVDIMKRVICYTESHAPVKAVFPREQEVQTSRQLAISKSIIGLSRNIKAAAIVAETKSGATAIHIACERPEIPIIAVTDNTRTACQLSIVYGIESFVRPARREAAIKLTDFLRETNVLKRGDIVVTASGTYPGVVGSTDTIKVRQLE